MALAFEAGCRLMDMELVQFHPTGVVSPPELELAGRAARPGSEGLDAATNARRELDALVQGGDRAARDVEAELQAVM
jgi:aspartate oxidase